jgi:molecular chaperone GrpE (heat shock protein)
VVVDSDDRSAVSEQSLPKADAPGCPDPEVQQHEALADRPDGGPEGQEAVLSAQSVADKPVPEEGEIAATALMVGELIALTRRVDELATALASQSAVIARFHERSAAQEEIITRLHDRVQTLQAGETRHLIKPVVGGLVALYGEILTQIRGIHRDLSRAETQELLEVLGVRVENTLATLGVEPYGAGVGDPFNPRRHQAIDVVTTDLPDQHQTVAAVLRPGFEDPTEPRPMFVAQVTVSKYVKSESPAEPQAPASVASSDIAPDAPADSNAVSQPAATHQKELT